jgi:dTDP-glucose 4,6-dehydratase
MTKLLVTGGYGFIGAHLIIHLLENTDYRIICIDAETYASQKENIKEYLKQNPQYRRRTKFIKKDISNYKNLEKIFQSVKPDGVINVAAESHVDNSITGPAPFISSNIVGTFNLLECSRKFDVARFVQVSTDEVYGQLHDEHEPHFTENHKLEPSSVYSASKASADLLVESYYKTFKLNTCITRCCNNYGPYQHKEKLLPKTILNALNNHSVPVYGKGENMREWIYVVDHCEAILKVYRRGRAGETYNIGTGVLYRNIDLVKNVLELLERKEDLIEFVEDRKGHDFIYAIDCSKTANEIGWQASIDFAEGLKRTIEWYKNYLDNAAPR